MTTRDPNERLPTDREGGEAGPATVAENVDSPNDTGPIDSLDPAGQALFERIAGRLDLPISVSKPQIGGFEIRGDLGQGGMGVVHRAFDPKLGREVALKRINARRFANPELLRARLLQEAQVLAKLEHPNIVRVYAVGEHEGEVYVALERVDGPDLQVWQEKTSPSRDAILRVFVAAGNGLAAAHERDIVHRDFKPENVLIARDGRVMVSDFGLAGSLAPLAAGDSASDSTERRRLTSAGDLIGTPGYAPPEQMRGEKVDARSDQFAFCVSLWELLTEERPFPGRTWDEALVAMTQGQPSGGEGLPRWLRGVLVRGLSMDPRQRFPSMKVLVQRLERGLTRRRRWLLGAGLGLAATVTITSIAIAVMREPEMPCPLEDALTELRGSADWHALTAELDEAGHRDGLTRLEVELERRVARLCKSDRDAAKQQLLLWLDALARIAASVDRRTPEQLQADIDSVRKASFDRPPPIPIPPEVAEFLNESEQLEREDRLPGAIEQANEALRLAEAAESPAGRALGHLRRGRALALSDRGEHALADYERAKLAAYEAQYSDASLRSDLLTARTEIMRLDRLDLGEKSLQRAKAQLVGLHERLDSPRWTEYYQLDASLNWRRGRLETASRSQYRVLIRTLVDFDGEQIALALINLGTIHELAGRNEHAEACYRLALKLLTQPGPTRHQAEYALGHLLAVDDKEDLPSEQVSECRRLLNAVITADAGQRISATYSLLLLAFRLGETEEAGRIADELSGRLIHAQTTAPRTRFEAWQLIAMSKAERGLDYEMARSEVDRLAMELPDGQEKLVYFELQMVDVLGIHRGRLFADRLMARLPTLADSERAEIVSELDRLRASEHSSPE